MVEAHINLLNLITYSVLNNGSQNNDASLY
nr:MAG TPA: hypothetical protein [Bacteriophage sp.]